MDGFIYTIRILFILALVLLVVLPGTTGLYISGLMTGTFVILQTILEFFLPRPESFTVEAATDRFEQLEDSFDNLASAYADIERQLEESGERLDNMTAAHGLKKIV